METSRSPSSAVGEKDHGEKDHGEKDHDEDANDSAKDLGHVHNAVEEGDGNTTSASEYRWDVSNALRPGYYKLRRKTRRARRNRSWRVAAARRDRLGPLPEVDDRIGRILTLQKIWSPTLLDLQEVLYSRASTLFAGLLADRALRRSDIPRLNASALICVSGLLHEQMLFHLRAAGASANDSQQSMEGDNVGRPEQSPSN